MYVSSLRRAGTPELDHGEVMNERTWNALMIAFLMGVVGGAVICWRVMQ